MKCTNCGNELSPNAAFCGNCGATITQQNPHMPTATPTQPAFTAPAQPTAQPAMPQMQAQPAPQQPLQPTAPGTPTQPPTQPVQQYQQPAPYPQQPPMNTMAILALVMIFVFLPIAPIFGFIAMSQIKKTGEQGHGLALGSTIASLVIIGLFVLTFILAIIAASTTGS